MEEVKRILSMMRKTFEKGAWHGPTVKEVLQDVTPDTAFKRLDNTHSIIELVTHMTTWRNFVVKKLKGDVDFKVTDELNFPSVTEWPKALQELEESQRQLIQATESFPPEKLAELVPHPTYKYTFYTLLHGIVHHDLYHIGQIALIKKTLIKSPQ